MADEADIATSYIENEVANALKRLKHNTTNKPGAKNCKECDEVIPVERRKLGFQLCIQCAEDAERRKSLFAD